MKDVIKEILIILGMYCFLGFGLAVFPIVLLLILNASPFFSVTNMDSTFIIMAWLFLGVLLTIYLFFNRKVGEEDE